MQKLKTRIKCLITFTYWSLYHHGIMNRCHHIHTHILHTQNR